MKKKFILILLTSIMFLLPTSSIYASTTFKDIENHWAKSAIITAYEQNMIGGYSDGTFKPNGLVTYGEFLTMLNRSIQNKLIMVENNNQNSLSYIQVTSEHLYNIGDILSIKVILTEDTNKYSVVYPISYAKITEINGQQYTLEVTAEDSKKFEYISNNKLSYELVPVINNNNWAFNSFKSIMNHTFSFNLNIQGKSELYTYYSDDKSFRENLSTTITSYYKDVYKTEDLLSKNIDRDTVTHIFMMMYANIYGLKDINITLPDDFIYFNDDINNKNYPVRLWAKDKQIFNGYYVNQQYQFINKDITRAEAVIAIQRFLNAN